jgi:transcription factor SPN1
MGSDGGSPQPIDFAAPTQTDEDKHSEQEEQQRQNADEANSDAGENHHDDDEANGGNLSDNDSDLLSEIDEDQFDNFDSGPAPVTIDEDVTKTLKAAKRKRVDGETTKKPKEGKRQKKRARSEEDDFGSGNTGEPAARRPRKARTAAAEARSRGATGASDGAAQQEEEDETDLTPEERRRRALERAMDAAVKGNPNKRRRKKDEVDLEDEMDEHIASLKVRMETACEADNTAREQGRPAVHKLKLLPEVTALLNRSSAQDNLLDPETNFLQSIKFFIEPLNDGSLPAYNIQRDIFTALTRLPIEKDALLASGIGKVVLFYTRSKRPEVGIKRMAERLLGEWSRPILKRTDDYKKRHVETRDFDYAYVLPLDVLILFSIILHPEW